MKKSDYKNTELNKQKKNSKGIYYSSGNYEAFARPKKPKDIEKKSAYLVGSGLASLAAACFLIRDAQMSGDHIHILEASNIAGGACDGVADPDRGYIMRGGREMEDHFECLWDLFHSIPSLEHPENSVLDEFYWLNKEDPNYSLCRATNHRGKPSENFGKFNIDAKGRKQIMKLFFTANEKLYDKTIEDVFDEHVFDSDFWLYWRTMFAFENWHSALELKLYLQRFIHHIGGLPDFSALKFTRYNQYESLILPMIEYLKQNGVIFHFHTQVTNVIFSFENDQKVAKSIEYIKNSKTKILPLTKDDLVFVTNGSCTESTLYGDHHTPANGDAMIRITGCWNLWKNIAKQDPSFGHPEKFCGNVSKTRWESATITTSDTKIIDAITRICKRDPLSGKRISFTDSCDRINDLCITGCDRRRFPTCFTNISTEFLWMTKGRILFCNILPKIPAPSDTNHCIAICRRVMISIQCTFGTTSICHKDKIIFCQRKYLCFRIFDIFDTFCNLLIIFK